MERDGSNRNSQNLAKDARNRKRANQEIGDPRRAFSSHNVKLVAAPLRQVFVVLIFSVFI
jgi:hypothetical protein